MTNQEKPSPTQTFRKLIEYIDQFEPIKLLTQLFLTHLIVRADESPGENDEANRWTVRIELLAGYLLGKEYPLVCSSDIDGAVMQNIEDLFDEYDLAIDIDTISRTTGNPESDIDPLMRSIRHYARWVRGDCHTHQYFNATIGLYGSHQTWFLENLGFTIGDAIVAFRSLTRDYDKRIRTEKKRALGYAKNAIIDLDSRTEPLEDTKASIACEQFFGRSDEILAFTRQYLSQISGLDQGVCGKILNRLSQEFGYKHPKFPNTFQDPRLSPWDYNTLYERPLIHHNGQYWMILTPIINPVLMNTFFFDLMADDSYKPTFEDSRGKWIETETYRFLLRIFPHNEVFLNPLYPNGDELSDVLVLHDQKILIFQCKAKSLTLSARMGKDSSQLKLDLKKAVENAYLQGARARNHLLSGKQSMFWSKGKSERHIVKGSRINGVYIINVTQASLQNIVTRWSVLSPPLGLFQDKDYPWSVSLTDLDTITEILNRPEQFLHFIKRRLRIEYISSEVLGDELDILGFYLSQGLYFESSEFKNTDSVMLSGMSHAVDKYMFEKYTLKISTSKPLPPTPKGFMAIIGDIMRLKTQYRIDVAMALLDLSYNARCSFTMHYSHIQELAIGDHKIHDCSMYSNSLDSKICKGISCISSNTRRIGKSIEHLLRSFVKWKIGKERMKLFGQCKYIEWIGLGWDANTASKVDAAIYILARVKIS